MTTLRYTLVAEGTSDMVLLPILRWMLLRQHPEFEWMGQIAELQVLPNPPRGLARRIAAAGELFPADVIFIHRDADREPPANRRQEISDAIESLPDEAWLLVSESALRAASGNRSGRTPLGLPPLFDLETIPDPKRLLQSLLVDASELSGRRRKKFNFPSSRLRIPDFVEDWEILLHLPSAKALFDEVGSLEFKPPTSPSSRP